MNMYGQDAGATRWEDGLIVQRQDKFDRDQPYNYTYK